MSSKSYIASSDILVKGRVCDAGSKMLSGFVPPFSATVVSRLDESGFTFEGQAPVKEFALSADAHTASAETVMRTQSLALVSDCMGQARLCPAKYPLSAYRPTYGVLSRLGLVAVSASMDTVSLLSPSLALCGDAMRAMTGIDEADSTSVSLDWPKDDAYLRDDMQGKTIGVIEECYGDGERAAALSTARAMLEQMGARVTSVSLPGYPHAPDVADTIVSAEFASATGRYDGVKFGYRESGADSLEDIYMRSRGAGFGPEAKRRILFGTLLASSAYYQSHTLRVMRLRGAITQNLRALLETCDALLTPVGDTFAETSLASLAGLCAVSVGWPGSPYALQLIGRAFDDARLLGMGASLERAKMRLAGGAV